MSDVHFLFICLLQGRTTVLYCIPLPYIQHPIASEEITAVSTPPHPKAWLTMANCSTPPTAQCFTPRTISTPVPTHFNPAASSISSTPLFCGQSSLTTSLSRSARRAPRITRACSVDVATSGPMTWPRPKVREMPKAWIPFSLPLLMTRARRAIAHRSFKRRLRSYPVAA